MESRDQRANVIVKGGGFQDSGGAQLGGEDRLMGSERNAGERED